MLTCGKLHLRHIIMFSVNTSLYISCRGLCYLLSPGSFCSKRLRRGRYWASDCLLRHFSLIWFASTMFEKGYTVKSFRCLLRFRPLSRHTVFYLKKLTRCTMLFDMAEQSGGVASGTLPKHDVTQPVWTQTLSRAAPVSWPYRSRWSLTTWPLRHTDDEHTGHLPYSRSEDSKQWQWNESFHRWLESSKNMNPPVYRCVFHNVSLWEKSILVHRVMMSFHDIKPGALPGGLLSTRPHLSVTGCYMTERSNWSVIQIQVDRLCSDLLLMPRGSCRRNCWFIAGRVSCSLRQCSC